MVRGVRRGCVRLKGAVIGIDDEDDSTFTVTVDHKTFHFQARDADEREKWVRALEDTIFRHGSRVSIKKTCCLSFHFFFLFSPPFPLSALFPSLVFSSLHFFIRKCMRDTSKMLSFWEKQQNGKSLQSGAQGPCLFASKMTTHKLWLFTVRHRTVVVCAVLFSQNIDVARWKLLDIRLKNLASTRKPTLNVTKNSF